MTYARLHVQNVMLKILRSYAMGRANAMTRADFERRLSHECIDLSDRKIRDAYSTIPICSSEDGLFIPTLPSDLLEYERYLTPKVGAALLHEKMTRLRLAYPHLVEVKQVQVEMFAGMEART